MQLPEILSQLQIEYKTFSRAVIPLEIKVYNITSSNKEKPFPTYALSALLVPHAILGVDLHLYAAHKGKDFSRCYSVDCLAQKIPDYLIYFRRRESLKIGTKISTFYYYYYV